MTAIRNQRDKLLRTVINRGVNPPAAALYLLANPPSFTVNAVDEGTPNRIEFSAIRISLPSGVVSFSATGGSLVSDGDFAVMYYDAMTADTAEVTARVTVNGQEFVAKQTINKIKLIGKDDIHDALLDAQITVDMLGDLLQARLALIDGEPTVVGSVNARIKKETDDRIAAIDDSFQEAIEANIAYVQTNTYSKNTIDQSEAAQTNNITAAYTTYVDGKTGDALVAAQAYVRSYSYAKADSDGAIAALASTLRAEMASNGGASVAYVNNYAFSKADTISTIASQTSTLSTTVDGHTSSLQIQAQSIGGLGSQLVFKIDNNGRVAGMGLASTVVNGVPQSAVRFLVDAFVVGAPGVADSPMFEVGLVKGIPKMVVKADATFDGAITARMLTLGPSDNAVLDPDYDDVAWWGRPNQHVDQYDGSAWKSKRTMTFSPGNGNNVFSDSFSQFFPMTPGAVYKIEYQVYISGDFQGRFSPIIHLPAQAWYTANQPGRGYSFAPEEGAMPVLFDTNSPKGLITVTDVFTMGSSSSQTRAQIRLSVQALFGFIQFGGLSITRMADTSLIVNGGILARHLELFFGGHINLNTTDYNNGNGIWFEGPGNGHGARLFVGDSNGRKMLCDPANGVFQLVNPDVVKTIPFAVNNIADASYSFNRSTSERFAGTYTASSTGANGQVTYSFSLDINGSDGGGLSARLIKYPETNSVAVYVRCNSIANLDIFIDVTAIDTSGAAAKPERFNINLDFT